MGPDGKPLHNPHVIRVDVYEVKVYSWRRCGLHIYMWCCSSRMMGCMQALTVCQGGPAADKHAHAD